jgi:hypothetical protein
MRPLAIRQLATALTEDIGFGYEDCTVTHEEALCHPESNPEQMYCSGGGTVKHLYDWDDLGCDCHKESQTMSIIVALVALTKKLSAQITNMLRAGGAMPNITVLGTPNAKKKVDQTLNGIGNCN